MDYQSGKCPVCDKAFSKTDDVVICPDCGAPYHRACYQQAGHCLFQDKHGTGFEYKTPEQRKAEAAGAEAGPASSGILCKNCNTVNDARNIFCEKCGAPLHNPGPAAGAPPPQNGVWPPQNVGPTFYGQTVYGPQMDYSGEIDGISKRDWAAFVGRSAPVYLQRLSQMSLRGSKISFMFSALFLGPFYFAYRKMWLWAAVSLVLSLALGVPNFLLTMAEYGVPLVAASFTPTLINLYYAASILTLVVNVLTGMFALQLYRMGARKKIMALRELHAGEAEYREALGRKGGVSIPGVVVLVALLFALSILLYYFIGDAMVQVAYSYMTQL